MSGGPPGKFADVRRFDEIDSTNTWLLDQARAGASDGLVAVADHQTAGRGRLGRSWIAPRGSSLLVSILMRQVPAAPIRLAMAVALAARDACGETGGVFPSLKWPNDLEAEGRKLAGVLAESLVEGGAVSAVVVGIGINCNWPETLPDEIAATATALNHLSGCQVDREAVLAALLGSLDERYPSLEGVIAEYRGRCSTIGQHVRVELASGAIVGDAMDVDDEGHLLLRLPDGTSAQIAAGDVVHLRGLEGDPGKN